MTQRTFNTLAQSDRLIGETAEFLDQCCEEYRIKQSIKDKLQILSDELLSNIKKYSCNKSKNISIHVTLECHNTEYVELTIADNGETFNPLEVELQDIQGSIMEREIGGLGLHLVKTLSSSQHYKRHNNYNHVIFILNE